MYIQLAQDLGIENVVDMAHRLGIKSELDAYLPTAIGGLRQGVTPLEMASAYATFANQGIRMKPYLIDKVVQEKGGEEVTLKEPKLEGEQVISRDVAAEVNKVMTDVGEFYGTEAELGGRPVCHQDRYQRAVLRRLVRRLHSPNRHERLGGLPGGSRPDGQHSGLRQDRRRSFPDGYLDTLHAACDAGIPGDTVSSARRARA